MVDFTLADRYKPEHRIKDLGLRRGGSSRLGVIYTCYYLNNVWRIIFENRYGHLAHI